MKLKNLLCLFALVASAASSHVLEHLKSVNDRFTDSMFKEVIKERKEKGCILSALTVLCPLAQLALAAVGDAREEILSRIHLSSDKDVKELFAHLFKRLLLLKGIKMKLKNKLYVHKDLAINPEFTDSSKDTFDTEVENIDFDEGEKAVDKINTWVQDRMDNHIKRIDLHSIGPKTKAILISALYLKGKWLKPFAKSLTKVHEFHVNKDKKISLPHMRQLNHFKYIESPELGAKILRLDYEGGEVCLYVVLPNSIDGIHDLVAKANLTGHLHNAIDKMLSQEIYVSLPRFKLETSTNLKTIFEKMKIIKIFVEGHAKLKNLLKEAKDAHVSEAVQDVVFEVDETGTEEGDSTAVDETAITEEGHKTFIADHPFALFVMENRNILCSGVYSS